MYVEEIIEVKDKLEGLKKDGLISAWELPYEELLTRLDAAIFYTNTDKVDEFKEEFKSYENFTCEANEKKNLSELMYEIRFAKPEQ